MRRRRFLLASLLAIPLWFVTACLGAAPGALNAGFTGDVERALALIQASGSSTSVAAGSALCGAAGGGRQDTIERLLSAGVPIDTTDGSGGTPLQYAAMQGQTDTVRFLLQHGAKASHAAHCTDPGCKGHFAIVSAVRGGKIEIVNILLEAGADPTVLDNFATQKANDDGNTEMFRLLKNYGGQENKVRSPAKDLSSAPVNKSAPAAATAISKLGLAEVLPLNHVTSHAPHKEGKLRLAIIADDPNANAADLLTAKLSKRSSMELVERQELIRILAEQNLTRQFAADAANYSKVAALLHADALLLIHNTDLNGTRAVESRFIRVDPGLVLDTHYQAAPLTNLPEWTAQMERRIDRFSDRVVGSNTIAVSFLNLRASLGNASNRSLERILNLVLQARLSNETGFVLLERNAMQRLMVEDPAHPFCSGAYLVDGSIEPALDKSGLFNMSVRFQPAVGKGQTITAKASGRQSDPGPAIDEILQQVHARLANTGPASPRDSTDEAQTYLKEAEWALGAGLGPVARSAADSAWALGLHNLALARIRALAPLHALAEQQARMNQRILTAYGGSTLDIHDWLNHPARGDDCPTPAEWLDLAIDGGTVWSETLETDLTSQPNDLKTWLDLAPEVQSDLALGLIMIDTAAEQSRQAERLTVLRQVFWHALETAQRRASALPGETGYLNSIAELQAKTVRLVVREPAPALAAIRDLLKLHFTQNDSLTRAHIRLALNEWGFAQTLVKQSRQWSSGRSLSLPDDNGLRKSLIIELRTSPEPDDRFLSGLLEIARNGSAPPGQAEVVDRIKDAMWDMRDLLAGDKQTAELYLRTFNNLVYSGIRGVPIFQLRTAGTEPNLRQDLPPEFHAFRSKLTAYVNEHAGQSAHQVAAKPAIPPPLAATSPAPPVTVQPVRPSPSLPLTITRVDDSKAIQVEKFWTPFGRVKLPSNFRLYGSNANWCEGHIWLCGMGQSVNPSQLQRCLFRVDPVNMQNDMTAFPPEPFPPDGNCATGLAVTPTHIIVTAQNTYIAVFDRVLGHWEFYRDIKPLSGDTPLISNGSVFLFVHENPGSALVRFDLKTRTAEVLASTRRYPPASPLDDVRLEFFYLGQDSAGNIIVEGETDKTPRQSETYAWSPESRQWQLVHPFAPGRKNVKPYIAGAGWSQRGPIFARSKHSDGSTRFTMRLRLQTGAAFEIPLTFSIPPGLELPQYSIGKPLDMFNGSWRTCPAGLVFVPNNGGFWFLPDSQVARYFNALQTPADETNQTASNR